MKTLLITDTWDVTSDIVVRRLAESIFRLNTDIIRDYEVEWTTQGFRLSNPNGRRIELGEIGSVYWRKPFTSPGYEDVSHPDYFLCSEARYLVRELYNVARAHGAHALVEEGAERRVGKIRQLLLATRHFKVPEWKIVLGQDYTAPPLTIAKSLSGEQIDAESVLYTTRIDGKELSASHIWFTQRAINKSADITVCFVQGRAFGFELPATDGVVDWRATLDKPATQNWRPIVLPPDLRKGIGAFMEDCGLRFGRLDFVVKNSEFFFLEVNPNGQWAWLDPEDKTGLTTAMIDAIRGDSGDPGS